MGIVDIGDVRDFVDRLFEEGPAAFADPASVEDFHIECNRIEAFFNSVVGEFDAWGEYAADGAQSAAAWLTAQCRIPAGHARNQVRRSREMRQLNECAEAWRDGDINAAHVDALCRKHKGATQHLLERDEAMLVGYARTLRFSEFTRAMEYWSQRADPDGTESDAEARRNRRDFYLVPSMDGMYFGRMNLDPISGAIVSDELRRIEAQLFEADRQEAKARLGFEPTALDLLRTHNQRRADALVEMATRSKSVSPGAVRPAPLFSVLVDYETLHGRICQLAQGTVISPGSLLPWLDQAYIERAVFDPPKRVDVSATVRLFTGGTRRALELRDQMCTHPYCEQPAADCQADHVQPYALGGPTTQENGRVLCGFHNRLRNGQRPPLRE
jgi:hypothetical protein